MMKTIKYVVLGLFLLGVLTLAVLSGQSKSRASPVIGPSAVQVAAVTAAPEFRLRQYHGVVKSSNRAVLSFAIGGRVSKVRVKIGDSLKKGQPLAVLDTRSLRHGVAAARSQVQEARAQLSQLQSDQARLEHLVSVNAAPVQQLERLSSNQTAVHARLDAAIIQRREARRMLKEGTLRAPFAGVISETLVRPGEVVGPGTPIAIITGDQMLEVEVEVPEAIVGRLDTATPTQVVFPFVESLPVEGKVSSIGSSVGRPGRLFPVLIQLPIRSGVLPGMTAQVQFSLRARPTLMVPVAAILNPTGQQASVFAVRGRMATRVHVEVGELLDDKVSITGDLRRDDVVIVGSHTAFDNGQPVEVQP